MCQDFLPSVEQHSPCVYAVYCIYLLMDIWVVSLWLLWINVSVWMGMAVSHIPLSGWLRSILLVVFYVLFCFLTYPATAVCNVLRTHHVAFWGSGTILHSHQQFTRVPVFPCSPSTSSKGDLHHIGSRAENSQPLFFCFVLETVNSQPSMRQCLLEVPREELALVAGEWMVVVVAVASIGLSEV